MIDTIMTQTRTLDVWRKNLDRESVRADDAEAEVAAWRVWAVAHGADDDATDEEMRTAIDEAAANFGLNLRPR